MSETDVLYEVLSSLKGVAATLNHALPTDGDLPNAKRVKRQRMTATKSTRAAIQSTREVSVPVATDEIDNGIYYYCINGYVRDMEMFAIFV